MPCYQQQKFAEHGKTYQETVRKSVKSILSAYPNVRQKTNTYRRPIKFVCRKYKNQEAIR